MLQDSQRDQLSPERIQPQPINTRYLINSMLSSTRKRNLSLSVSDDQDDSNVNCINEINHSHFLSQDFSQFLFQEQLSDITVKVLKSNGKFDNIKLSQIQETGIKHQYIEIPAHKVVLAARCPYFNSKFCRDWKDGNEKVCNFEEFSENSMREFMRYIYTGKLKIDISNIMGILKIASFLGLNELNISCKQYLTNGYLNAFDLCILYCEVRDESQDFDEMRNFLTKIIAAKIEIDIICRVLKEIYINEDEQEKEEEEENEEEQESSQDLQDILIQKIQKNLPEILQNEQIKQDFFQLTEECIKEIFASSESCVSEIILFKSIEDKIQSLKLSTNQEEDQQLKFYQELLKQIRLPHINIKQLVTDIKCSSFFDDQQIFKAIQFQVARETINTLDITQNHYRGVRIDLDLKHQDLSIKKEQGIFKIQREKITPGCEHSYISCLMSEQLPLHGIHYWELRIKTSNQQTMKQVFIGLCNTSDNQSLEDTHRSKSSVLLNCYDSSFWSNGQQIQVFSNKFIKVKQPINATDIIRLAVDFRYAKDYSAFWKEPTTIQNQGVENIQSSPLRNNRGVFQTQRERLRESLRYINLRDAHFYLNNEIMFLSSRCKYQFAFNNSEFHEGIDLNLTQQKDSPLNLVISMLEEGVEVELSKAVYFDEWDMIPKEPFILKNQQ